MANKITCILMAVLAVVEVATSASIDKQEGFSFIDIVKPAEKKMCMPRAAPWCQEDEDCCTGFCAMEIIWGAPFSYCELKGCKPKGWFCVEEDSCCLGKTCVKASEFARKIKVNPFCYQLIV